MLTFIFCDTSIDSSSLFEKAFGLFKITVMVVSMFQFCKSVKSMFQFSTRIDTMIYGGRWEKFKTPSKNNAGGFNVVVHDGRVAGQSVPHVHVRVLPRKAGDFEQTDDSTMIGLQRNP